MKPNPTPGERERSINVSVIMERRNKRLKVIANAFCDELNPYVRLGYLFRKSGKIIYSYRAAIAIIGLPHILDIDVKGVDLLFAPKSIQKNVFIATGNIAFGAAVGHVIERDALLEVFETYGSRRAIAFSKPPLDPRMEVPDPEAAYALGYEAFCRFASSNFDLYYGWIPVLCRSPINAIGNVYDSRLLDESFKVAYGAFSSYGCDE